METDDSSNLWKVERGKNQCLREAEIEEKKETNTHIRYDQNGDR